MRFHSAVISSFLLASAAVAHYQISGGSLLTAPNDQPFHTVLTSVDIPQLSGEVHDSISVMATLGSPDCPNSAFVGFTCVIEPASYIACKPWFHVPPGDIQYFDLPINPKDIVIFGVTSPYHQHPPIDKYVTYAFIENTNTSVTKSLTSEYLACGRQAGWGLSNTPDNSTFNGIARFGQLEFTTTLAYIPGEDEYGPANGKPWNMTDNEGNMIAIVKPSGDSMVVTDNRG